MMLSRMALRRTLGLVSEAVSCHSFHTTPSIAAAGKSPLGQLRKQTGYSLSLCKKALAETQQDVDKAKGSSLPLLYYRPIFKICRFGCLFSVYLVCIANVSLTAWLEERAQAEGWNKANKLEGRNTSQGLIGLQTTKCGTAAAMVELNRWVVHISIQARKAK